MECTLIVLLLLLLKLEINIHPPEKKMFKSVVTTIALLANISGGC
jgi:hypothetical protein